MYTCPFHYVPLFAVDELLISPVTILLSYSTHDAEEGTRFSILFLFAMCSTLFSYFPVRLYERGVDHNDTTSTRTQMGWFFGNIKKNDEDSNRVQE